MNTAILLSANSTGAADFSNDTWWITLIKAVFIVFWLIISVIMALWVERRGLGRIQTRPGPNVHGPLGLFQAFADAIKLLTKEDIFKRQVDKVLYLMAPIVTAACAFCVYAVIPFGPSLHIGNFSTPLQLTDSDVAVLYMLAVAGLGIYGIILAGWASNGHLPLYGATRSAAQVISYELAMGMSLVSVFVVSGSMKTSEIVAAQSPMWWCIALFPAFVIYIMGEVNRLPFDLPECEGEIVAGHMTEYSSMKFAWFYLAEYINMFNVSGICVTLFLGGWRFPGGEAILGGALNSGLWPFLWFGIKVWAVMWFMIWVRGTLLRVRYDQLMMLGWKILLPVSIAWMVVVVVMRVVSLYGIGTISQRMIAIAAIFIVALVLIWVTGIRADNKAREKQELKEYAASAPFDAFAGGYPVPPMPGQTLPPSPRALTNAGIGEDYLVAKGGESDE